MKRITVLILLAIAMFTLTSRATEIPQQKSDSLIVQKKSEVFKGLQAQYDYHEQKFQSSLTKEQRGMQDEMKAVSVQMLMIDIVKSSTDTTITTVMKR